MIISVLAVIGGLVVTGNAAGCSRNEPTDDNKANHRQPTDPDTNEEPKIPEEQSPIVGDWMESATGLTHSFMPDGSYAVTDSEGNIMLNGSYFYDAVTSMLRISTDDGTDARLTTYRCVIEGDRMTLYDMEGHKRELSLK